MVGRIETSEIEETKVPAKSTAAELRYKGGKARVVCRFSCLTNAFSKKIDTHCAALTLYFFHYNFCRQHKTLRVSPAMAAGITDELLSMEQMCKLMDDAVPAKKRGAYNKQAA